jgi:uncharacterized repeat protein (TIGR01451 family)
VLASVVAVVAAFAAISAPAAQGKPSGGAGAQAVVDITSSGPLTNVYLSNLLNCQVSHTGDTDFEFYEPSTQTGDCVTAIATGGTLYRPQVITAGSSASPFTAFTPVSQTAVTGTGTDVDPFKVITVVDAGSSGLRLTETDTYVVGSESYRTDVQVSNTLNSGSTSFILYRAGDCFLQGSDEGFGDLGGTTPNVPAGEVGCHASDDGGATRGLRIERWIPITAGSSAMEAGFDTVWQHIGTQTAFANTCTCDQYIDNGAGISWSSSLTHGTSATFSHFTVFSPTGQTGPFLTKAAATPSVPAGSGDSYTITLHNVGGALTVNSITDHLPDGFTYVPGSTTGATTANPTISGNDLTWAGPFTVAAGGTLTLTFSVKVGTTAGTFNNSVDAVGANNAVIQGSGATAPITVTPIIIIAPRFTG